MTAHNNKLGYTLPEVLMAAGIIGVAMGLGALVFTQVTRNVRISGAKLEIQRGASVALDLMNRNLRQASASSVEISQLSGQPPYSKISFSSVDGTPWSFYQQDKTLYMTHNGSTSTVCENLRYIAFTYPRTDSPKIISVSVTLEKATYEGQAKALQLSVEKVRIMND